MPEQVQAVVAGSKAFVDALDAHLRLRLGAAPLLARSPVEAMKACEGEGGLLVLEYGGPDWLEAVKSLRTVRDRAALPIVAAVPSSRMAELGALQRAGVDETVRWDARVDPVLWAVDRLVAARSPGRPSARSDRGAPVGALRSGARPRVDADGSTAARASVDSTHHGASVHGAAAGAPACPDAQPRASAEPEAASEIPRLSRDGAPVADDVLLLPLPPELPSAEEVAKLLRAALAREVSPDEAWRPFTERVASQLGDMERVALSGAPFPLDAAPLRTAACLRWRIAAVLEGARATGAPPDPDVAGALPIEVDAALAALKVLAEAAGAELQPGIEAARNALVREAIGFTDAVAEALVPGEARPAAAAPASEKRPAARVITNESADSERAVASAARPWWIALALVFVVVATYHGWRIARRPAPRSLPTVAGAPAGTYAVHSGKVRVLKTLAGRAADAAELERFRAQERAKGNDVREAAPGTWVIEPAPVPEGGTKP